MRGLAKSLGGRQVLREVSFELERGTTLAVLGRSGSGKTTLLRAIAGLVEPDGGSLELDGRSLAGVPPQHRGVVYLYQEPLLFPHLSVWENVAFGLRLRGEKGAGLEDRVDALLASLELADHAGKRAHELSGGQRLRVFPNLEALIADPATGIRQEIQFWQSLVAPGKAEPR